MPLLKRIALYSTVIGSLTLGTSTFAQPSDEPLKKSGYPTAQEREEAKPTFQKLSEFGNKFHFLRYARGKIPRKPNSLSPLDERSERMESELDDTHRKLIREHDDLVKQLLVENGISIKPNEEISVRCGFVGTDSGYWDLPHSIYLTTYTLEKRANGDLAMTFKNSMEYTLKKDSPNIGVFYINEKLICEPRPSIKRAN